MGHKSTQGAQIKLFLKLQKTFKKTAKLSVFNKLSNPFLRKPNGPFRD